MIMRKMEQLSRVQRLVDMSIAAKIDSIAHLHNRVQGGETACEE